MTEIKGILFDFDGVLAKSMEFHYAAWRYALNNYNIELKEEDYYPLEGMNVYEMAKKFCRDNSLDEINYTTIVQNKKNYFIKNYKIDFYPGVNSLIDQLKNKGIKIGIVTASLKEQLEKTVPEDFLNKFNVIITSNRNSRGKPFPDPYLRGLTGLCLNANECIVIENAPLGIKSAKSAGMHCIGITSTVGKEKLSEADEIIEHFSDLIASNKLNFIE